MRRLWRRLPVIVRAVVVGWVVSGVGHQVSGVLFYANLQWWRAVPWSAPLVILWLWMFWQYFGGRWWPASTSQARAEGLAARPLSPRMWRWALVAGGLGMISIALLSIVLSPITPKTFKVFYSIFVRMPFPTVRASFSIRSAMRSACCCCGSIGSTARSETGCSALPPLPGRRSFGSMSQG